MHHESATLSPTIMGIENRRAEEAVVPPPIFFTHASRWQVGDSLNVLLIQRSVILTLQQS